MVGFILKLVRLKGPFAYGRIRDASHRAGPVQGGISAPAERSQSRDWLRADRHSSASTCGAPDERTRSPSRGFDARDSERYGQRSTLSTPLLEPIMQEFRTIHFAQSLTAVCTKKAKRNSRSGRKRDDRCMKGEAAS